MAETIPEVNKLPFNFLGRSGLKVSVFGLGTALFRQNIHSTPDSMEEGIAYQLINRYVEWGGNFLDTADVYGGENRNSEVWIGKWLESQPRDQFVIGTKCGAILRQENREFVNQRGLSRHHITTSIEQSLKALRTDYVDLLQTHFFDNGTPLEETLRTLNDLVRLGKVHYVGVCNVTGWQMQKIVDTTEKLGLNPIVSLQQQYSLASRESELEAFQVCKSAGIGVLPWCALKGGLLTGKVKRGIKPIEGRMGWVADHMTLFREAAPLWATLDSKMFDIIEMVEGVAKKHGRSASQVALRWLLQKDIVSSVITGVTSLAQLDNNMAAATGWSLSQEEMTQLDEISQVNEAYPYAWRQMIHSNRMTQLDDTNPANDASPYEWRQMVRSNRVNTFLK